MPYTILRTETASKQLSTIIQYIANTSSTETALSYLDHLEKAIMRLQDFPYMGVIPKYPILRHQGYRVLTVKRHLIFYKVNEEKKTVYIYAIIDSRREYIHLL